MLNWLPWRHQSKRWHLARGPRSLRFTGFGGCCCGGGGGCQCSTQICVEDCSGNPIVGATVTVGSLAPATTTTGGCVSFCLDALGGAGSYQTTVSDTGFFTFSNTKSLACDGTTTVKLLPNTGPPSVTFEVTGCNGAALPGATVEIGGSTYTTDVDGKVNVGITDAGTFGWEVSFPPRFVSQSGSVTLTSCGSFGNVAVQLLPASGFFCCQTIGCPFPWMETLDLTDSEYGGTTVTYDPAFTLWTGTIPVEFQANMNGSGCPASSGTMGYQWGGRATVCCSADSAGTVNLGPINELESVSINKTAARLVA
jgi:hypothetical protein